MANITIFERAQINIASKKRGVQLLYFFCTKMKTDENLVIVRELEFEFIVLKYR